MVLSIKYNTYSYEINFEGFLNKGKGFQQSIKILKDNNHNKRIENWFFDFLVKYQEELNEEQFEIVFTSTKHEIDIVKDIIFKFNKEKNYNVSVQTNEIVKPDLVGDFKEILINIKQKNKEDEIKKYFVKHKLLTFLKEIENRESQVVVAATMSAGKSTLINALIGKSLMPSKNAACTATICKIKDVDGEDNFKAIVKNEKNVIIRTVKNLDAQTLSEINEEGNDEFLTVEIEGDIKNISSKNMSIVLVDTPGPNNSENNKHKEVTFGYIKDNNHKPLLIYVLDVTKLNTNDDKSVLEEISSFVKGKGISVEDRFLFVLNRIDELDHEKESLEKIIGSSKEHISNIVGIENPKIFPVSAEFARLDQLRDMGEILTRSEKGKLKKFESEFLPCEEDGYEGIETIQFTPLREEEKRLLLNELKDKGKHDQCLHRSGILALKVYIQKYIEDVHEIELGHNLIRNLKPHFDKLKDEVTRLTDEEKIKINEDVKKIENSIQDSEKKLEVLKDKLNEIPTKNNTIDSLLKRVEKDFSQIFSKFKNSEATKHQALEAKSKAESIFNNLKISLKTSINLELENDLNEKWDEIINIIKNDFNDLINDLKLSKKATSVIKNDFSIKLNNKHIDLVRNSNMVKTGEVEVSTSTWWKPLTWYSKKKEDIFEYQEQYNLTKLYDDLGLPKQKIKIENMLDDISKKYNDKVKYYIKKGEEIIIDTENNFSQNEIDKILNLEKKYNIINHKNDNIINDIENYLFKINRSK
jgi:GTPase Era involved in 16S rRNA processing